MILTRLEKERKSLQISKQKEVDKLETEKGKCDEERKNTEENIKQPPQDITKKQEERLRMNLAKRGSMTE